MAEREIQQQIKENTRQFEDCFNRKDVSGVRGWYADDALLLPPGTAPVRSADGIQQYWQKAVDNGLAGGQVVPDEVIVDGPESVVERGHWVMLNGSRQPFDNGHYVHFWRKQGNQWRVYRDIFNSERH